MTVLLGLCAGCLAQQPASESLLIGSGDLLHILVFREPDLEQKVRVRDSGEITLELAGGLRVSGMTPAQASAAIERAYQSGSYLNHPQVSVSIDEYATQGVAVLGQVTKPGMVPVTTPVSILDVLSLAGGLTDEAERRITIERGDSRESQIVVVPNRASDQVAAGKVMVRPGDKVIVPKAGVVYVLGDVGRPGGYVMQDDAQLTVLQALAMAFGSQRTASEQKARLLHKVNGVMVQQRLRLRSIEEGKSPDLQLAADDIIYIPFSLSKNLALGSASIVSSASSAVIYTGHL